MDSVDVLEANIREAIRKAKRSGTTGMSYANLKQITPTDGLTCHPAAYHREFPRVAQYVAMKMKFELHHDAPKGWESVEA
jgi:hypothetical protein